MGKEEKNKKEISGVCVIDDAREGEIDWYGVIKEILELEYVDELMKTVVLFNCEWYDPTRPSRICKHNHYKITEVHHTKRYRRYNPFIIAKNVNQIGGRLSRLKQGIELKLKKYQMKLIN